jgi:transposase
MAVVQLRNPTEGRAYYDRKVAAGKTPMEVMRALKRRLSDIVYRQMIFVARSWSTGPGGHVGAATGSSAAGSHPGTGTWEKSLPGPPPPTLRPSQPARRSVPRTAPATPAQRRPAAAVKRTLLDAGEVRSTFAKRERPPC